MLKNKRRKLFLEDVLILSCLMDDKETSVESGYQSKLEE